MHSSLESVVCLGMQFMGGRNATSRRLDVLHGFQVDQRLPWFCRAAAPQVKARGDVVASVQALSLRQKNLEQHITGSEPRSLVAKPGDINE